MQLPNSSIMRRFLPALSIVLVAGLTLASGLIHGRMSSRWGPPEDLLGLGRRLQQLPVQEVPGWQFQSSEELDDYAAKELQCAGYVIRTYQKTGRTVTVTVLVGPAVPLTLHPPEICYRGAGYQAITKRQPAAVRDSEGSDHEFWTVPLQPSDVTERSLQVYYAWSTGGRWSKLEESRFKVAAYPYLYKIQVATQSPSTDYLPLGADSDAVDACKSFLRDFVPVAKRYMTAPSDE